MKEKIVGTLSVDSRTPCYYNQTHLDRLRMFSEHIGVAIENARLFTRVTELATIDELTGLNNRRNFIHIASAEIKRAGRYQKQLAALMIDIDHFKEINDSFGHQVGDTILQEVGSIFRTSLREVDVCGRYGGDEFCILFPETDIADGELIAGRLLDLIRQVPVPAAGKTQFLTASIGLSSLDHDHCTLDALLQRADQALYLAKQHGRNQVRTLTG